MFPSPPSSPETSSANRADPSQGRFAPMYETQEDVLEDLTSRFILNLPDDELNSIERISFQVEQAHWYYEDFIREANPRLPSLPLKKFSAMLFDACPLLHRWEDHEQAFTDFMQYKTRVPVCGAIMLNDTWEKCVLVKGWKSSSGWGFPKGKINEAEPPANCAVREVLEETGYNLASQINPDHVITMSIKEQKIALYVVPGVPEDYPFKTKTRKEISKIEWFKLADLPTWKRNKAVPGKFYLITPFISPLKSFIREHKPPNVSRKPPRSKKNQAPESRPPSRHRTPIADSPYASSQEANADANQESSSQSSVDNGDPQTPSPQSISTAANHIDVVSTLDTNALDPHFAKLLNSLSLSGATAAQKEVSLQKSVTSTLVSESPALAPAPREPTTPIPPITDSGRNRTVASPSTVSEVTPRRQTSQDHFSHSAIPSTLLAVNALQSPPTTASSTSTSSSAISPTLPRRGSTSRRTSSTADISPYLSKATEIPSSAKRLKQIALLEAVADESARMSPILQMRDAVVTGAIKEHAGRYSQPPLPPSSVPPPSLVPNDSNVIYSSAPLGGSPYPVHPAANIPVRPLLHDDPFLVRPRTSQAINRPMYPAASNLPGSMSMNQSQLLALMNPPQATGAHPVQLPLTQSYHVPPPLGYTPFPVAPPSRLGPNYLPPFPMQHRAVPVPTGAMPPLPQQIPLSAPPSQPVFKIPPPHGFNGNPLLSILNGNLNAASGAFHGRA